MGKQKIAVVLSSVRLQIYISSFFILITILAAIFNFIELQKICVCISNYLAYSWILFGISIIFGLILFLQLTAIQDINIQNKRIIVLTILQTISFIGGIVIFVLFGALLLDLL
ncbi:MAG: hypothetical protein HN704_03085 [Bacteroidetes bacterium]|nr:hypothetical protein [Bacteroidota bacterium]MBT6687006.1 hypothetical protein [Bacteroidota bacterium]MBT7142392.1 hypothetical protein [Bacteroidota bacterium]MBT7490573.1 hypothetical protein [Bacteroidota bacterium]